MSARAVSSLVLLAALIAAAYGGSVNNEFVHDDALFMTDPRVQSVATLPRLLREPRWGFEEAGPGRIHQYYRPLEPLPYIAAHLLGSARPPAAHLVNLALHLLNTLLVATLLRRWLGSASVALAGAAVFAVYPAYSEAVLWPAAAGGLGAFACTWAIFLVNVGAASNWWRAAATAALFLAALFFKETGVMAPLYVLAGWWLLAPRPFSAARYARFAAAVAAPAALYAWLRAAALGHVMPRLDYLPFTWLELALNGAALVPTFARSLLWPFDLCFHHDFTPVQHAADPAVLLGAAALLAAPGTILLARRRAPVASFGIAAMLVAALLLFVGVDRARSREWRDEVTLFTRTLEQSHRAEIIRVNLGVRLLRLGRVDEAIAVLEELRRIDPHYRGGLENLALCYHAAGRLDDAVAALEEALRDRPRVAKSLLNLAYFYDEQGRRFDAATTYFRAIAVDPAMLDAWNNLAIIALEEGQLENARRAARRVRALAPSGADGTALLRRIDAAAARPADAAATARRCNGARPLVNTGRYPLAVAQLRAAAWLDETSALPHQFLANVFVLSGDTRAALRQQRAALQRAPDNALYRRNLRALRRQLAREQTRRKRAALGRMPRDGGK